MENIEGSSACGNFTGWKNLEALLVDELKTINIISDMVRQVVPISGQKFGKIKGRNIFVSTEFSDGFFEINISCNFIYSGGKPDFLFPPHYS